MTFGKAVVTALTALLVLTAAGPANAVSPPDVVVGPPPPDDPPGPEVPTVQDKGCVAAGVLRDSDLSRVPPAELALDLDRARALSRGAGVTVAVVDTGVSPNRRLPGLAGGGDYVTAGGDGLADCDAHGTLVAGIIGATSDPADGFTGVAPEARILSIRYRSGAFRLDGAQQYDELQQRAMQIRAMARAITHAANLGAGVIVVPLPVCVDVEKQVDQSMLAAAIGHAVHVRGALIVAGAGNAGSNGCQQNPGIDPSRTWDPRNWEHVKTISVPGWYSPAVLTVGFTTAKGEITDESLTGPWVSVSAPGTGIESLGPGGGGLINGVGEPGKLVPVGGSSFAAAYVAGVAALLRSRFPNETPAEISARLQASAHEPARGIDNTVGAGMIDPLAALSYRTPPKPPAGLFQPMELELPEPPRAKDNRPGVTAAVVIVAAVILGAGYTGAAIRRQR
ncbi:type VII secretion-associated serine protease mycosin [Nocardia donostiensis]|uniref:Type VII secretion-associated serine protease mycosin n=1 Tax=Nocardia donostiensis TaxID=1538463 RepID=A0A1W0B842_9NOCA|nr:type VII secretion-associated serine protease mycosin [Nocardia donostiensis]ONM46365.1 type VII secretion-associated serine protease mycosin [Nocardia donostiensis]OQS18682.1 type VII secretion-associated serine protease mycosin [Nocardia donostiensis]